MNQTVINLTDDFQTLFASIAPHKNRYAVFSDFVFLTAAALRNAVGHQHRHLFNQDIRPLAKIKKRSTNWFFFILRNKSLSVIIAK